MFALLREWTFLQLQVTLTRIIPFHPTSYPSTSINHHSCLLCSTHLLNPPSPPKNRCLSNATPCDNDDDVTLMPVSCFDCVLKMCILSVLACCTSVWSPGTIKSMLKRECSWGIGQKQDMMGGGLHWLEELWDLRWWQSIDLVPFVKVSVVNVVVVSVLMLIFLSVVLARTIKKKLGVELNGGWNCHNPVFFTVPVVPSHTDQYTQNAEILGAKKHLIHFCG